MNNIHYEKVPVSLYEDDLVEFYVRGCVCPAEGKWVDGVRHITALHVASDCPVHGATGNHLREKMNDWDYVSVADVPPAMFPDPAHHQFFAADNIPGDAGTPSAGPQHRGEKPISTWEPSPLQWKIVSVLALLTLMLLAGLLLYPGW